MVAIIAITVYLLLLRKDLLIRNKEKCLGVYFIGILMGLHWVTFFHSMQVATIAIGMISLYTYPIMVVLMESAIQQQRPKIKDILSSFMVLIGILLLMGESLNSSQTNSIEGVTWGIISAVLFASRNILIKYRFHNISSEKLMLHQAIMIAIMLLAFIDFAAIKQLNITSWLLVIALAILGTATAHTLLVLSYKNLPAKTVALSSCLQPVIGAIAAWIVIKEQPSIYIFAGGIIILGVAAYEVISNKQHAKA
jgi:drug/metabolite transporter (DMT)-like permease